MLGEFGIKCDKEVLDLAGREDKLLTAFYKDSGELIVGGKARVKGLISLLVVKEYAIQPLD